MTNNRDEILMEEAKLNADKYYTLEEAKKELGIVEMNECFLRPEVMWFAMMMENKLRQHDKVKGADGWKNCTYDFLMDKFQEELCEVQDLDWETGRGKIDKDDMIGELIDVANICMMLVDNFEGGNYDDICK